jgi:hypothetical protein
MAKTIIITEIRKRNPRIWLKTQKATALSTIHRLIARLPRVSKALKYSFASLLMGFNSFKSQAEGCFNM